MNTFIQIAASIGPSLFIGVLSTVAASSQGGGIPANVAQTDGFAAAVAVACAIAAIGTVLALAYSLKRRRLAQGAQEAAACCDFTDREDASNGPIRPIEAECDKAEQQGGRPLANEAR